MSDSNFQEQKAREEEQERRLRQFIELANRKRTARLERQAKEQPK